VTKLYVFVATLLLFSYPARAEYRIKIAVIDTGINVDAKLAPYMCSTPGHDFSGTSLVDQMGHGTMITALAVEGLDPSRYCVVMVKWMHLDGYAETIPRAINYAVSIGARVINMSLGGTTWSRSEEESVERALAKHIHVVVAAGNDHFDLSRTCPYYPACYRFKSPYFHVVASYDGDVREKWSNYGRGVTDKACGVYQGYRGTSYSAARVTNRIARGLQ
jgi:cell wall-associated protease